VSVEILFVDDDLVAVAKPAGRIVVPGRGAPERTVRAELQERLGPLWVVHRLDRGTSGVLLFARNAAVHRALCSAFEHHQVVKRYLALVKDVLSGDRRVDVAVAPGRKGRMRAGEGLAGARPSTTFIRMVASFPPVASLVEAYPASGRTHQVRVHLAHAGHPLLVDPDYGDPPPWRAPGGSVVLVRTPLHAASVELLHPTSGAPLRIEAPLAPDVRAAVEALRVDHESKSG
jgi:tRNA pseudouridine32 synthase/23S rRNA pseudouridine746 synthase